MVIQDSRPANNVPKPKAPKSHAGQVQAAMRKQRQKAQMQAANSG